MCLWMYHPHFHLHQKNTQIVCPIQHPHHSHPRNLIMSLSLIQTLLPNQLTRWMTNQPQIFMNWRPRHQGHCSWSSIFGTRKSTTADRILFEKPWIIALLLLLHWWFRLLQKGAEISESIASSELYWDEGLLRRQRIQVQHYCDGMGACFVGISYEEEKVEWYQYQSRGRTSWQCSCMGAFQKCCAFWCKARQHCSRSRQCFLVEIDRFW